VDDAAGGQLGLAQDTVVGGTLTGLQTIATVGQQATAIIAFTALSALFAFFLLRDAGRLFEMILARIPTGLVSQVRTMGGDAAEVLGGYMFGTAVVSLVGAASQWLIMVVLGIPLALPVFVLSFFLCFIPYIGGFLSTGIAFLLTVLFGSTLDIAIMAIWTIVFNIVTGNIVSPLVYGRTVRIHPAIVLLAIPAGGAVGGVLGMFIVIPVLGVVAVTWRTVLAVLAARRSAGGTDGIGGTRTADPTAPMARSG
jgi:predicted PurR-regulated permease PerM